MTPREIGYVTIAKTMRQRRGITTNERIEVLWGETIPTPGVKYAFNRADLKIIRDVEPGENIQEAIGDEFAFVKQMVKEQLKKG